MKTLYSTTFPVRRAPAGIDSRANSRGIALVIVLAFLVLISGLVVAFFSNVQTDLSSAKSFAAGATVKQLAETATNVVLGQISDATKTFEVPAPGGSATGKRLSWASQPGMIHTFGDDGEPARAFKLYSAKSMVHSGGAYKASDLLASEVPAAWPEQPAMYTDLNSPVLVADPAGTFTVNGNSYRAAYPILDPSQLDPAVQPDPQKITEGFGIDNPPGYAASTRPTDNAQANRAAMPVAWLYVLRNGNLTAPTDISADGLTARWTGTTGPNDPTADNPIVGRVAFWTDDETSKININTASEPTSWDSPRAVSKKDLDYGRHQPFNNEFQRYPGHPGTVALSPVLFPNSEILSIAEKAAMKTAIYGIVPRIVESQSKGGTVGIREVHYYGANPDVPDGDRLYANLDEIYYQPALVSDRRAQNTIISSDLLRRSSFFLTATSRAPEVNLFGLPRVSMWPATVKPNAESSFDKLAQFCTTITNPNLSPSDYPFYFSRLDPESPTADYASSPAKIARNKALYPYLQALTDKNIPGFGGKLASSWGADRDQILTEIFDYIRCTNPADPSAGYFGPNPSLALDSYSKKTQWGGTSKACSQVAPLRIGSTQGFGRFYSISQIGIQFISRQNAAADPKRIEAAILIEPFCPSLGYPSINESMKLKVTIGRMTLGSAAADTVIGFPTTPIVGTITNNGSGSKPLGGDLRGGTGGLRDSIAAFIQGNSTNSIYLLSNGLTPANSQPLVTGPTMVFSGGTVQVEVFVPDTSTLPVQTFNVTIPGGTFPVPEFIGGTWKEFSTRFKRNDVMEGAPYVPSIQEYATARTWSATPKSNRMRFTPGFNSGSIIHKNDVVRSVVPSHGDLRLTSARQTVGSEFVKVDDAKWESPTTKILHIFQDVAGSHFIYGNANEPGVTSAPADQLTGSPAVTYHYASLPEIKPGAGSANNLWGDFDNGLSTSPDGAYINQPDGGNTYIPDPTDPGFSGIPYFTPGFDTASRESFSPSRLIPSPGMLGSLPTGVKRDKPWQTLLFRPQPGHPGAGSPVSGPPYVNPPDFLAMDLFWMPVAEPYAISEPFSTAGRINMNYEIAPFTYIRRATAMHAVLKGEEPMVIPNNAAKYYKAWAQQTNHAAGDAYNNSFGGLSSKLDPAYMPDGGNCTDPDMKLKWPLLVKGLAPFDKIRLAIDPVATLKQFDDRFKTEGVFRSATQICQMHLVRKGEDLADYQSEQIWKGALPTGDNTRERPYTNLYAKLTTKSNSFTVHMRVQVLSKRTNTDPATWVEGKDHVAGEYRGSTLIERYIDTDSALPDFATATNESLDDHYRFRTVSTKKFTP